MRLCDDLECLGAYNAWFISVQIGLEKFLSAERCAKRKRSHGITIHNAELSGHSNDRMKGSSDKAKGREGLLIVRLDNDNQRAKTDTNYPN